MPEALFTLDKNEVMVGDSAVNFTNGEWVRYTNNSIGADTYWWYFGDEKVDSLSIHPIHQYNKPGSYDVTLIAKTSFGCRDTLVMYDAVIAKLSGRIKFPEAFMPSPAPGNQGGGVVVDQLLNVYTAFYPRYRSLDNGTYKLTIYNRWGEVVFRSEDPAIGWDGSTNGKLCPQDVYTYIAEGYYENQRSYVVKGTVTLIR